MTHSTPLWEGLTKQWTNVSCIQECLLDPAVAGALRLQLGASLPQKNFARQYSSISGIMENHNTHLAPGFTLNDLAPALSNVATFWGLLGPGGFNSLYQSPSSSETAFPRVARERPGPQSVLLDQQSHTSPTSSALIHSLLFHSP